METTQEKRLIKFQGEIREASGTRFYTGRAVVYNSLSEVMFGSFREQIAPGAFDASLATKRDIIGTVNHDPSKCLGRLSAGTLSLTSDERGIGVEAKASNYSYSRDLEEAITRGDMRGMSFIFDVKKDSWTRNSGDDYPTRTVLEADIYEVSWVYTPAYPETEAGMRSAVAIATRLAPIPLPINLVLARQRMAEME